MNNGVDGWRMRWIGGGFGGGGGCVGWWVISPYGASSGCAPTLSQCCLPSCCLLPGEDLRKPESSSRASKSHYRPLVKKSSQVKSPRS